MTRIPPIDSVEHIGQLRGRDSNYAVRRRWPDEAAFLQPFGVERHAETVMPKNLNQVTSGASKDIKITCVGICDAPHIPTYVSGVDMWRRGSGAANSSVMTNFAAT
jgi:hypothetical protein